MNFYWVNVGKSHKIVKEHSFLWAPSHSLTKKNNKVTYGGWKFISKVKKGDVLFCCFDQKIQFVAISNKDSYEYEKPKYKEFESWPNDGYKVDIDLHILNNKIYVNDIKDEIIRFNKYCEPVLLYSNNNISQNYLISLPVALASLILKLIDEDSLLIQNDISKNNNRTSEVNETTTEAIIKARVGQGKFRNDVLNIWNNTCPISNVNKKELLIASHIVSWQLSNDEEKLDPYNGLPLTPSLDKLFDKGYISFSDDGNLLFNKIYEKTLQQLGINNNSKINNLKDEHKAYLKRHRELYKLNI